MSTRDRQRPRRGGRLGKIVIECGHRPRVAFAEPGGAGGEIDLVRQHAGRNDQLGHDPRRRADFLDGRPDRVVQRP